MNNKSTGTRWEQLLALRLSLGGYWVHMMKDSAAGQPADIIAVKGGKSYLIDAKDCRTERGFDLSRIEDNQHTAMRLWSECGNGSGLFGFNLPTIHKQIFVPYPALMKAIEQGKRGLTPAALSAMGIDVGEWMDAHDN